MGRGGGLGECRVGGETATSMGLGIIALEQQDLICPHLWYVEPAVLPIERHRVGLSNTIWIDEIGGNELLALDSPSVADGERRIAQGPTDWTPQVDDLHAAVQQ